MDGHIKLTELDELIEIFKDLTGIRYSHEKIYLFENRLSRFVGDYRPYSSYRDFIKDLRKDKKLQNELINTLTTNYTFLFREEKHFRFLRYIVHNKFLNEEKLRLWSAAASAGHEAYSMAISLLGRHSSPFKDFSILATDIASEKIEMAKKGIFTNDELEGHLRIGAIEKYFKATPGGYIVKDFVKKHITFSTLNILGDYPFRKKFHIIFLRNILIYFKPGEKEIILKKIADVLDKNGYLIISLSESLTGLNTPFKHISSGIYNLK